MIYYDDFQTWRRSFDEMIVRLVGEKAVERLASSNFEFIDDAGDLIVSHADIASVSKAVESWLWECEFCVFHGTRLLNEEIVSVRELGLLLLVASDRASRLRKILCRHPRWTSVENRLNEVIEDVGRRARQGERQGQVHFSLSHSGLLNRFNHYLKHGSEFDQHVVERLFRDESGLDLLHSETAPLLVHVSVTGDQLIKGSHPHLSYSDIVEMGEIPGLAATFLNTWAFKQAYPSFDIETLKTDCCMKERVTTPPERILRLESVEI